MTNFEFYLKPAIEKNDLDAIAKMIIFIGKNGYCGFCNEKYGCFHCYDSSCRSNVRRWLQSEWEDKR